MNVRFVRMEPSDLEMVVAAEQALNPSSWTLGNFRDALYAGYEAWLATDGEQRMRAYAVMEIAPGDAHLHIVGVLREWQRQGYGRLFLRYLKTLAATRGVERLLLEVRESNIAARALYGDFGFTEIGRRRDYYPSPRREDALVLACDLEDR